MDPGRKWSGFFLSLSFQREDWKFKKNAIPFDNSFSKHINNKSFNEMKIKTFEEIIAWQKAKSFTFPKYTTTDY